MSEQRADDGKRQAGVHEHGSQFPGSSATDDAILFYWKLKVSEKFSILGMPRRPARFTQADIARAIRAAEQAGSPRTVEIAPDGTIKLVPVEPTKPKVVKKREIIL
jgi:hypothetical protein